MGRKRYRRLRMLRLQIVPQAALRGKFRMTGIIAILALTLAACGTSAAAHSSRAAKAASGSHSVTANSETGGGSVSSLPLSAIPKTAIEYHKMTANVDVTDSMLRNAGKTGKNWLTYGKTYQSQRYTPLTAINQKNVKQLRPICAVQTGKVQGFETNPIIVNGVMYLTSSQGPTVMAVNAATCQRYWTYSFPMPNGLKLCCGADNRGVAVADGRVYFTTLDDHLVALNARTGNLEWAIQVADPAQAYSETLAPLAYKGNVIIGISGAEYGIHGWIRSYTGASGHLLWQFNTVNFKTGTWGRGNAKLEGGGSTWMTGSLNPATNTLFWGVGNPSPDFLGSVRPGRNLYTESTVALNATTGKLKWYYQYTPHDLWDYDSIQPPILIGHNQVAHCDKNGWCYILNETTGKLIRRTAAFAKQVNEFHKLSRKPVYICPGPSGATEWDPTSYSPRTGDLYVSGINMCGKYTSEVEHHVLGQAYWGSAFVPNTGKASGTFTAISASTGKIVWQRHTRLPMVGSALTTASNLVFTGNENGEFEALNAGTGQRLWKFRAGAGIHAPAVAYTAGGREYVAVAIGDGGWTAGFGATGNQSDLVPGGELGDTLYVFGT